MSDSKQRILIVDDAPTNIRILADLLQDDYHISAATNGPDALEQALSIGKPDLILLDVEMPEMDGYEVCRRLKANERTKYIPVLFVTARNQIEDERKGFDQGGEDYITKPIHPAIVRARVRNHMNLHLHQEHLEALVQKRTEQVRKGYIDTIERLVMASEYKDENTGSHIRRISYYTKELAQQLGMGAQFCDTIFYSSPMHDIGKVAIPDAVLLKQGPLDKDEWRIMKAHTEIGQKLLQGSDSPLLQMAADIAGGHHERWDGGGYPGGLKGEAIPLPARIMCIADQYDALRSTRPYKPAFNHEQTLSIITKGDDRTKPDHFDPQVLTAFKRCTGVFSDIFDTHYDK
ncbi:response regulator [Amphritea sp. HPY]|uniref:response regulator n=1 Tax=Amphritea sp. HPY TaxID=3421652 RepID=UPI003D7E2926